MADSTDLNVVINAVGGDGAAAEIMKANDALVQTTESSSRLQGKFQQRFQHIGLMLFAGDAARAAGLGRETRMVVSTLNLALTEGAAAAGLSSTGLLLIVAALGALAGILVKVIGHHKDHLEQLQKLIQANDTLSKSYGENIAAVNSYADKYGTLNKFLLDYRDAQIIAKKATDDLTAAQHLQVIQGLNLQIAKMKETMDANQSLIDEIEKDPEALKVHFGSMSRSMVENIDSLKAKQDEMKLKLDQTTASLKQEEGAVVALHHGYSNLKDMMSDLGKTTDKSKKSFSDLSTEEQAAMKKAVDNWKSSHKVMVDETSKLENTFSQAMAKMIVTGENFTQAMHDAFTKMAEDIIAMILKMIEEWMVFQALTGIGGMQPGRAGALSGWNPSIFGATGFSGLVDKPTMFVAGEAGPESVNITPMSQMGGSQGGGSGSSIQIGTVQTNVYGITDPDAIADQVGLKIVEQIRAFGQIDFSRAF